MSKNKSGSKIKLKSKFKTRKIKGNLNSLSQSTSTSKPPLHNYLKESRMKRQEIARRGLEKEQDESHPYYAGLTPKNESRAQNWKSYLDSKKLSSKEKLNIIQEKAKKMEERALKQEKLISFVGGPADQFQYEYKNNEVNDMLIDAIQAKLAVLDQMK